MNSHMNQIAYLSACIYGFAAVALGAFGAHALEDLLLENGTLEAYETGNRYHILHSLLLLGMGFAAERSTSKWLLAGIWSAIVGIFIFAFSLYVLSVFSLSVLGAITPIGGVGLLLAWAFLGIHFYTQSSTTKDD